MLKNLRKYGLLSTLFVMASTNIAFAAPTSLQTTLKPIFTRIWNDVHWIVGFICTAVLVLYIKMGHTALGATSTDDSSALKKAKSTLILRYLSLALFALTFVIVEYLVGNFGTADKTILPNL